MSLLVTASTPLHVLLTLLIRSSYPSPFSLAQKQQNTNDQHTSHGISDTRAFGGSRSPYAGCITGDGKTSGCSRVDDSCSNRSATECVIISRGYSIHNAVFGGGDDGGGVGGRSGTGIGTGGGCGCGCGSGSSTVDDMGARKIGIMWGRRIFGCCSIPLGSR